MNSIESVSCICVICYLIGVICKAIGKIDKFIPAIVGVVGAGCGVLGFFVMPGFPADNIIDALAVGIVSGLSSTGVNQIYKQLTKEE